MVKEQWIGTVAMRGTLDNGKMAFKKDMVSTIGWKIGQNIKYLKMCIKGIGKMERERDLEYFSFLTVVDLKVIFLKIWKKKCWKFSKMIFSNFGRCTHQVFKKFLEILKSLNSEDSFDVL